MTDKLNLLHQELVQHFNLDERRFSAGEQKFDQMLQCQQDMQCQMYDHAKTQIEIRAQLQQVIDNTAGVTQLYHDFASAARLGTKVQAVGWWVAKWPLIGAGAFAFYTWVIKIISEFKP